ncbi:hypothetical protein F2P56_020405 [Juglans regia]|uniref:1-phosphatidylinositol 4-kinase n=2 Tax=Juglans regia TaxID=51240 RepID=A0A2I4EYA2_JUGRE|nr:phosphatidylinositol 4-kinase gamma 2-like isoform X2 [Juglans regia]KAF5460541.1 hypothetical protein F2P56_020405 [Juglans regia]
MSIADIALSPIREELVNAAGHFQSRPGPCSSESILIFLTVAGSVIPMHVLESDSITSVKLRIQKCKGFVVKKQKLVYAGRELARNDTRIKDYGVTGGDVLHLVLRLFDVLLITVRTICGKEFEFQVDRYRNVRYLKERIGKEKGKGFVNLEDQELFFNGEKLDDQVLIDDICNDNDAVIHLVVQKSAKVRAKHIEKDVEISVVAATASEKKESDDRVGEDKQPGHLQVVTREPPGNRPMRSSEGTGGAYFMQDSLGQEYVSVFKPIDEEPMAVHNPRGLPVSSNGEGLKRGTKVGEGALREVAAYILDHPRSGPRSLSGEAMGFAGVPPTTMVRCLHKGFNHPEGYECTSKNVKIGSLQLFMKNDGSCEDIGPGAFLVDEVHKISVLDIRMANTDRHAGNILFRKGEEGNNVLIPIDHGYCLPENFEDCTFDWLYWPQARKPYSPDTIEYINSLDAEQDIELLKFHGWDIPYQCARTLRISTMLLKKGVERGLTPFAIGSIMCRETVMKESEIEEIVREAMDSLLPGMSEAAFFEAVSQIMDSHLDKLAE